MDFRAHNRTLFIFSVLKGFFLEKLYGYKCFKPVDTWTLGHTTYPSSVQSKICYLCTSVKSVDTWSSGHTSKLNVLVRWTQRICLKKLHCELCMFKSVDTWSSGHTTKQCLSSLHSMDLSQKAIWICMFQISGRMDNWTHSKIMYPCSMFPGQTLFCSAITQSKSMGHQKIFPAGNETARD